MGMSNKSNATEERSAFEGAPSGVLREHFRLTMFRGFADTATVRQHIQPTAGTVVNPVVPPADSRSKAIILPGLSDIPLYAVDGSLVGFYSAEFLATCPGLSLTFNRRGHLRRAQQKPLVCVVSPVATGKVGFAFRQDLGGGLHVWALCGTTGSGSKREEKCVPIGGISGGDS